MKKQELPKIGDAIVFTRKINGSYIDAGEVVTVRAYEGSSIFFESATGRTFDNIHVMRATAIWEVLNSPVNA